MGLSWCSSVDGLDWVARGSCFCAINDLKTRSAIFPILCFSIPFLWSRKFSFLGQIQGLAAYVASLIDRTLDWSDIKWLRTICGDMKASVPSSSYPFSTALEMGTPDTSG